MIIGPHRNIQRFFDEYCCSDCGRSWPIDDPDPPQVCQAQMLDGHGRVMQQLEAIKESTDERRKRKS